MELDDTKSVNPNVRFCLVCSNRLLFLNISYYIICNVCKKLPCTVSSFFSDFGPAHAYPVASIHSTVWLTSVLIAKTSWDVTKEASKRTHKNQRILDREDAIHISSIPCWCHSCPLQGKLGCRSRLVHCNFPVAVFSVTIKM
jgi:hypothetical protein